MVGATRHLRIDNPVNHIRAFIFGRQGIALSAFLLLVAAVFAYWALAQGEALAGEDVVVIQTGNGAHRFKVEVVDTDESRARGLMFRQELAPNSGMLFDFLSERPVSFWMQNTYIPLDMLFVLANGEIVRIHENARPHDQTPIPSGQPVRFVLEIPGGRSAELGIAEGDRLEHPRVKR